MKKGFLIGLVAITTAALIFSGLAYTHRKSVGVTTSRLPFSLNLLASPVFRAGRPVELRFNIRDNNNNTLRDFDVVHEKLMHLIVVRKDRTNFQHLHPSFDKSSGIFTLAGFKFPADGDYRIFADCAPHGSKADADGMEMSIAPFADVKVGRAYAPQVLGGDKLTSDVAGISTKTSVVSGGAFASGPIVLGVELSKGGAPFKSLQTYLGALGHMVILGPNLEYIHAHAREESVANQNGLITFEATLPMPGQYKIYLQTQADGQVNTTDYTLTAVASDQNNSMPGMDMGH